MKEERRRGNFDRRREMSRPAPEVEENEKEMQKLWKYKNVRQHKSCASAQLMKLQFQIMP